MKMLHNVRHKLNNNRLQLVEKRNMYSWIAVEVMSATPVPLQPGAAN
jgi:hypothetical protein